MEEDNECAQLLADVRTGLKRHQAPAKTDVLDCTGGVYFMRSASGKKIAVFKPHDEEQGMPNNPKVPFFAGIIYYSTMAMFYNTIMFPCVSIFFCYLLGLQREW